MSITNNPDYEKEFYKLNYTIEYLKKYYEKITKQKKRIDGEVEYSTSHYNSDNAEQFNELIINTALQSNFSQRIRNIKKSISKPYFARIDFNEDKTEKTEEIYIGKTSLLREEDQQFLIIDWRAPIANLYYEGRLGRANYKCPDGDVSGKIALKRQYMIEPGEINDFFDIDITASDDFLQACLGSSKDNRLKDIVSTIQGEQNKVIRADMWNPLIVQGAAGGGKTTIALHRIAYLLYNYENTFTPDNFMIIAPNTFFLSYISEVLPELGVENVSQSTFIDFALQIIGKKYKIKSSHEKLADIINYGTYKDSIYNQKIQRIKKVSNFKSSIEFKNVIEKYIEQIETAFIPSIDFKIHTFTLLSEYKIRELFLHEYKNLPIMKRIAEIKKHLVNSVKYNKNKVLKVVEEDYDRRINKIRYEMEDCEERRKLIIKEADDRDALLKKIKKNSSTLVKNYMSKITPLKPLEYYKNLFENKEMFYTFTEKYIDRKTANFIVDDSIEVLNGNHIEFEDIAPILLIKYMIYGLDEKISVRHIVIDEAQDFSLFQLYVLKKIIGNSSFTILGDICQGIYSYRGINNWNDVSNYIFDDKEANMLTLKKSYRTTIEIMNKAASVIKYINDPNLPPAEPVIRHGEEVTVCEKFSLKEISEEIKLKINDMDNKGCKSAAIICKTVKECKELKAMLKGCKKPVRIIKGSETEYFGGVVVIPSYLAKGLEFDMVIVANASKEMYTEDELDVKLLYVAMTRPLHRLYIYSVGERAKMLGSCNSNNIEKIII